MSITGRAVDGIIKKATGLETKYVSEDEMVTILGNVYISTITNEEDYMALLDFIDPSAFVDHKRQMYTVDGRYEIISLTQLRRQIPNIKHWFYIIDRVNNICYQYSAVLWGNFKTKVEQEIQKYRGSVGYGKDIVSQQQMGESVLSIQGNTGTLSAQQQTNGYVSQTQGNTGTLSVQQQTNGYVPPTQGNTGTLSAQQQTNGYVPPTQGNTGTLSAQQTNRYVPPAQGNTGTLSAQQQKNGYVPPVQGNTGTLQVQTGSLIRGEAYSNMKNRFCTRCGNPVDANAAFCGVCGNTINQVYTQQYMGVQNPTIRGPYIIQSKSTDEKTNEDYILEGTPLVNIDFFSGSLESYLAYRELENKGIIPYYSRMQKAYYYERRVKDMLMIACLHNRIFSRGDIIGRIPNVELNQFGRYIHLDMDNYKNMTLKNVYLYGTVLPDNQSADSKNIDRVIKLIQSYPSNLLLYYNSEYFKTGGVAITDRYLYFVETNAYIPNEELVDIELEKNVGAYMISFKSNRFIQKISGMSISEKR